MEEYQEYALYANTPYLLNEDVAIEDIEQNLLDHGLDYKIDRDLSDRFSTVLVGDNKVIHSIRGTDFGETTDVIADMAIAINNPFTKKLLNTLSTIHGVSILQGLQEPYISDFKDMAENSITKLSKQFYQNQNINLMTDREFLMHDPDGPEISFDEFTEDINSIKTKISRLPIVQREEAKSKVVDVLKLLSVHILSTLGLNYVFKDRLEPERDKLKLVQNKYKNKEINLTGHSLGSIANILGRENKIKTITLNPAPQSSVESPHPDSKIYRTHNDLVSYFLYPEQGDKEPVIHIDSGDDFSYFKPFQPHFLSNFLPAISLKSVLQLDNINKQDTQAIIPQVNPEFKIKRKKKRFLHNHKKNLFMFDF